MNTVIYHRADYDGLFSAAVCKKFLPYDTEFIGWDYGDPLIPFPERGTVFIVDLSPDCIIDAMIAVAKNHERIIWIDHHKSSIEKWSPEIPGYRVDGVAACRLCWAWFNAENNDPVHGILPKKQEFVSRQVSEPLALTLAGEYDVWDLHGGRAIPFQFGLTAGCYSLEDGLSSLLDTPKELDITGRWAFPGDREVREIVSDGYAAMNWQRAFASQVCAERSYVREWEGRTFCILGSCHTRNSMWFPQESIPDGSDALMCWRYDGNSVKFSLYHAPGHEEHDLSLIATKYGGGGHRGACGFEMSLSDALEIIR